MTTNPRRGVFYRTAKSLTPLGQSLRESANYRTPNWWITEPQLRNLVNRCRKRFYWATTTEVNHWTYEIIRVHNYLRGNTGRNQSGTTFYYVPHLQIAAELLWEREPCPSTTASRIVGSCISSS
jgi:hypothetical protein